MTSYAFQTLTTPQAVFDYVVNHLRKQDIPSTDKEGKCLYRSSTPNDTVLSCAVGVLIPDKFYYKSLEGIHVSYLEEALRAGFPDDAEVVEFVSFLNKHVDLLSQLQRVHDKWAENLQDYSIDYSLLLVEKQLANVAEANQLTYTPK